MSEGYAAREAALDRINDDPAWAQRAYGAATVVPIREAQVWVDADYGTQYQIIARLDDWVWVVFYGRGIDPLSKEPKTYDVSFFQRDAMRLKYDLRPGQIVASGQTPQSEEGE